MATNQRDYQYDFVDPLPEECPCLVCLEVQVDPHQVTCCGKIFCKACLDQLIRRRQNCPNCRSHLEWNFPDLNTERRIKHLRVHCDNRTRGCEWVGYMKDLKDGHIPECPNHLVPCNNLWEKSNPDPFFCTFNPSKCGVLVQRHDLHKHMTQLCKWRLVKCSLCKLERTHHFITREHILMCPDVPVLCSNEGCEIKVKRRKLPEHQTSCPKQIVSCRYSSVGCKARITRENVASHNQECMEQHLDSAVDTLDKTCVALDNARKTLGILWNRVETLEANSTIKEEEDYHTEEYDYAGDQNCSDCGGYHASYEYDGDDDDF